MGVLSPGKTPTLDHAGKAFSLARPSDLDLFPDLEYIDPDFITHLIGLIA